MCFQISPGWDTSTVQPEPLHNDAENHSFEVTGPKSEIKVARSRQTSTFRKETGPWQLPNRVAYPLKMLKVIKFLSGQPTIYRGFSHSNVHVSHVSRIFHCHVWLLVLISLFLAWGIRLNRDPKTCTPCPRFFTSNIVELRVITINDFQIGQ